MSLSEDEDIDIEIKLEKYLDVNVCGDYNEPLSSVKEETSPSIKVEGEEEEINLRVDCIASTNQHCGSSSKSNSVSDIGIPDDPNLIKVDISEEDYQADVEPAKEVNKLSTKQIVCPVCDKNFCHQKSLKKHLVEFHLSERLPDIRFTCHYCHKIYISKKFVCLHIYEKHFFKCPTCEQVFSKKSTLNTHKLVHSTGINPSLCACAICSNVFSDKSALRVHMRIHTGEKPFFCNICTKSFSDKTTYRVHLRIHSGIRPYSCTTCTKSFYKGSDLKKHIRIHTGEKPYLCSVCSKLFTNSSDLSRHMRSHNGQRPHACIICSKKFVRKAHLNKHLTQIHHKVA